jgi:hypothetical protein
VAIVEWIDPIFVGANWMPALIELAGGVPVFGKDGEKSFVIESAELCAKPILTSSSLRLADSNWHRRNKICTF